MSNVLDKVNRNLQLKAGDILVVSSKTLMGRILSKVLKSEYSHVAIVIEKYGTLYLVQSSIFSNVTAVPIHDLQRNKKVLKSVNAWGCVTVRRRIKELNSKSLVRLNRFVDSVTNHSYEKSILELLGVVIPFLRRFNKKQSRSLFCSELVATCVNEIAGKKMIEFPYHIKPSYFSSPDNYSFNRNYTTIRTVNGG